ncbi:methyltransferase domain-containing protein [Streptomyces sp. NPDC002920]
MEEQPLEARKAGAAYERYTGRGAAWSHGSSRCGMGVGIDRSAGFVRSARAAACGAARFVVADAMSLPVRDTACDVAVSGLALNFLDAALAVDPSVAALDEGHRFPVCRPEPLRRVRAGARLADVRVAPLR